MNQDQNQEHLRLLSIFHYVLAGLSALVALIPVIHLAIGVAMLAGALKPQPGQDLRVLGMVFVLIAVTFILCGLAFSVLVAAVGRCLARRRKYMFCFVMACIECTLMPLGTILGVFTIIVLSRDAVKRSFGRAPGGL